MHKVCNSFRTLLILKYPSSLKQTFSPCKVIL